MRLLAIGDIHGCSKAFDTLLALVAPTSDDWLVTLGDHIDRGPDSKGVMARLFSLAATGRLISLMGNHEQMILDAREDVGLVPMWLQYGGEATLASYRRPGHPPSFDDIPAGDWKFLEQFCVNYFESEKHFFVHGNADPDLWLPDQPTAVLRWQKFFAPRPHKSGKTMVCGHTYQASGWPKNLGHAVCIDTWAYGNGWLTCLDVETGEFWQANQQGEARTAHLDQFLEKPEAAAEDD